MYHFVDLTDEEKDRRRVLLDRYAFIAQISVLAPLLALNAYRLGEALARRSRARSGGDIETPSSPHVKAKSLRGSGRLGPSWQRRLRAWSWWAGERVEIGEWELGTRGQVLGAAVWGCWLLGLSFAQTGDDYLHLTKRFGIVAASQLPLHYLLSAKTPSSPLQLLTRSSHETLNVLHQLLGRIVTGLLALHVILYLNFYYQSGLLLSKLTQFYIICGLLGAIAFTTIGTTALQPIRRKNYRLFYVIHITLAAAILPVLWFHVSHIRIYLYETLAIYIASSLLRYINTLTIPGTLTLLPGTGLLSIRISQPSPKLLARWQPGQHAYISLPGHPLTRTLRSNPFTNTSLTAVDNNLHFVARVLDGNTANLARVSSGTLPGRTSRSGGNDATPIPTSTASPSIPLSLEGPYGLATHPDSLLRANRVLLIAGGVGATFIVPLYRQLLADLSPSAGSARRGRVCFVWVAKAWGEVAWAFPAATTSAAGSDAEALRREQKGFAECARICLTREVPGEAAARGRFAGDAVGENAGETGGGSDAPGEEGIELEERKTLLSDQADDRDVGEPANFKKEENGSARSAMMKSAAPSWGDAAEVPVYAGRPDLKRLVDQTFAYGDTEKVAVVVCGPKALGEKVRAEVGRWVKRGREVWFWEERFAL